MLRAGLLVLAGCGRLQFSPLVDAEVGTCDLSICTDATFAEGGTWTFAFGTADNAGYGYRGIAVQPDDKVVVVGKAGNPADMMIVRLGDDGTLDGGFGVGGVAIVDTGTTTDEAIAIALDASGRIVVAGAGNGVPIVVRLTATGALDTSFGGTGVVHPAIGGGTAAALNNVVLDDLGRIVAGGQAFDPGTQFDALVLRLLPDGGSDPSFGTGGFVASDLHGLDEFAVLGAVGPGGTLYEVLQTETGSSTGFDGAVMRLSSTGARDATFGTNGVVTTDFGHGADRYLAMDLDAQQRPIAVGLARGAVDDDFAIARYTTAGALDPSFGASGVTVIDRGAGDRLHTVLALHDGRIFAGGQSDGASGTRSIAMLLDPTGAVLALEPLDVSPGGDVVACARLDNHGRVLVFGSTPSAQGTKELYLRRLLLP